MILRPAIRWITPWLTAYLLVVSIGFPLHRVYCLCKGEHWLSLTRTEHKCDHKPTEEVALPVAKHHHACCKKSKACQEEEVKRDCGDTEVIVAQLDADFTHEFTDWSLDLSVWSMLPPAPVWEQPTTIDYRSIRSIRGPDPPPKITGKQLLVAYQTFLI